MHLHHLDAITTSLGRSCCPQEGSLPLVRNSSMANCFRGSAPMEAGKKCFKDTLKVSRKSFGVTSNSLEYLAQGRENGVKLISVKGKLVKQEETQQLNTAGSLEKALPHRPLPPHFLDLNVQDSYAHRLVLLAISADDGQRWYSNC